MPLHSEDVMTKDEKILASLQMREAEAVIVTVVRAPFVEEIDTRLFVTMEEAHEFRDKARSNGFNTVAINKVSMMYGNDKTAIELKRAVTEVNKLIERINLMRDMTLKQRLVDGLYMAAAYSAVLALIILARP